MPLAAAFALALPAQALAQWEIDPAHTTAGFAVKHMVVSTVKGEFTGVEGTVDLRLDNPTLTKVDVEIPVASVDTRNAKRDGHLRSPDFFDADNFPAMKFVSTKVVKKRAHFQVHGDLTIRGVTKPVVLKAEISEPVQSPWGATVVGVHATTKIDRRDFGLNWNKRLDKGGVVVGNEVAIEIDMELMNKGDTPES
jgi:polyisoprenoid-binding protein YceI